MSIQGILQGSFPLIVLFVYPGDIFMCRKQAIVY